eukprot:TRINITY_DN2203_c0_g1_i3.p2 TRINITY_DN2203_c0_g1~~TRINITY_DN2203_c0_g1_i3.p2  ORF type:complete len:148 (-),score=12.85 TRINITY_DN2203_c0_g1_i3:180-623(-)
MCSQKRQRMLLVEIFPRQRAKYEVQMRVVLHDPEILGPLRHGSEQKRYVACNRKDVLRANRKGKRDSRRHQVGEEFGRGEAAVAKEVAQAAVVVALPLAAADQLCQMGEVAHGRGRGDPLQVGLHSSRVHAAVGPCQRRKQREGDDA